ncbi:MAG TPA: methyl-accepting chemotaxis protein [Ideonella sp.]|nr:methyl-accepting chemotaxis protein [Ideonella sp.]
MKLDNLRLSHKLWGSILLLQLAVLGVAGAALQRVSSIEQTALAEQAATHKLVQMATLWKGLTETAVTRGMAASISTDPAVGLFFKDNLAKDAPRIAKLREEIMALAQTPEDQALGEAIRANGKALVAASAKTRAAGAAGDAEGAAALVKTDYAPKTAVYLASIDEFVALQQRKGEQAVAAAADARRGVMSFAGIAALMVMGLAMAAAALLVRSIRRPLQASIATANAIAEGDLTRAIDTARRDEFGELMTALRQMNDALAGTVGKVRASTDSISVASREIATGNADLSSRTEQTASNLQQAASSMAQLTGTVRQSADSATTANQLASSAASVAQRGGEVVTQVVATMSDINTSSRRIADIIGTIDGIAFQTNILALNAAVEAARAGEQGRGFAVVASEVRSLAQRSAEAAKEIKTLIGASVERVESGSRLVSDAGSTMSEIVASVQRVADIIGEITAAAAEQSDGIGQVNGAVGELDQMTQQNAALVEQSSAAAESLKAQVHQLADAVGIFRLHADGPRSFAAA